MFSNLKKQKGSTIAEVLISVVIIGIVSVYGFSFFTSSYKFAKDSDDYNFVLHDLVRRMEIAKGATYIGQDPANPGAYTNPATHDFPDGISDDNNDINDGEVNKFKFDFGSQKELRGGCTVQYTYNAYENAIGATTFYGSTKIVCEATWPWEDGEDFDENVANKNKITLVTYVARQWNS